ncbi:alanine racemase, partial [Enterococcus faecalis]|nr:alanine racemase [Enterococcus faecalis]
AGSSIGYGATYQTSNSEWIGTVPIGYADGLTRDMQGFKVLIDGQFCEIIGRVSMDQITVRLPKAYPLGTAVTLIGQNGQCQITVQDWANYRETINYEIVCLLSDRIVRHYSQ